MRVSWIPTDSCQSERFTVEKIDHISYRDVRLLQQFISDRGKIIPRRLTGTSAPFQRKLTRAILSEPQLERLVAAVKDLEKLDDVSSIGDLLRGP